MMSKLIWALMNVYKYYCIFDLTIYVNEIKDFIFLKSGKNHYFIILGHWR